MIPAPAGPPAAWSCGSSPVASIDELFSFIDSGPAEQSYRYVVSTKGFSPGGYELLFTVASDPVTHAAPFVLN